MKKQQQEKGMQNEHLHDLFVDELRDVLGAEKQLLTGLKKLEKTAANPELKSAFSNHIQETEEQINTVKEVFEQLGLRVRAKKCKAMEGLLNEADEIIEEFSGDPAQDAALVLAAQKVEHYEIATYGTLVAFAKLMGHQEVADKLEGILEQEKATDVKLTELAMGALNCEPVES